MRSLLCFIPLFVTLGGAVSSACSSASGDVFGGTSGTSGGTGGGAHGSTGGWNGTVGSSGSGSFAGAGGSGAVPGTPPIAVAAPDAGPDAAAITCDMLDPAKPTVLYLSADDSNSMSSPALAREFLHLSQAPYAGAIRTYEFLNYYRIDYPAPPAGNLQIFPQAEAGSAAGLINLQIGVRSFDAVKPRRAITVTFVLDTSGSMSGAGIERERAAVKAIAGSLAAGDIVNMVTWNTSNLTPLSAHAVTGPNDPALISAANALTADGGTDLHGGLVAGYALAKQTYGKDRLNRVVLISDGGANVGVTDADLIALHSQDADQEGIYLVGVGAGPASGYSDALMDTVTDRGRGAYVYLDTPEEAARMFGDRFDETMEIAARGVQVELTLPWYFSMHKFYGEQYSTDPLQVEPQHLAPSDAMIFNQVLQACDPSVIVPTDPITIHAKWKTPLTYLDQETSVTTTVADLLAGPRDQLTKGNAIVAYAEALKTGVKADLHAAHDKAVAANVGGTDAELTEIAALVMLHPSY
jgi:Ca-activated chloride channel family protein